MNRVGNVKVEKIHTKDQVWFLAYYVSFALRNTIWDV